jgi:uncharacterized protein YdiU (UPF0061 family)
MSEYDLENDFDLDDDDFDSSFDDGSKLLKKLRRELTQTKKALKERDGELSSLKTEARKRTVRDVLSDRGLNPKIAAFIPESIDPTNEAITAWVDEYGDVFGVVQVSDRGQAAESNVDAAAIRRMSVVEDAGVSADISTDIANKIANASSREELQAILRNA